MNNYNVIKDKLKEMLLLAEKIEDYVITIKKDPYFRRAGFYKEFKHGGSYDDILRYLCYICSNVKNIPKQFQLEHPNIPWDEMHTLVEYACFDVDVIWHIVTNELPKNKKEIEKILNETADPCSDNKKKQ